MLDLQKMSAGEAPRASKMESGLTAAQVAQRIGVSTSFAKRSLKEDDAYLPCLEMVPRLCRACGNTIL